MLAWPSLFVLRGLDFVFLQLSVSGNFRLEGGINVQTNRGILHLPLRQKRIGSKDIIYGPKSGLGRFTVYPLYRPVACFHFTQVHLGC